MRMIAGLLLAMFLMTSCGGNYEEEQRQTAAERAKQAKEDSLALKIGTLQTLECLPLWVADEYGLFDTLGVDVRLKPFASQIDCDDALMKGRIEGSVTDVVKAEWMRKKGFDLRYATATEARWQFISNRLSRIKEPKQMTDKMVAMARFSATHLLADLCVDSAKLKSSEVYYVQINDPNVCLKMLQNNEMDAMLLPEPQATAARLRKNPVLLDTQQKDIRLGALVLREKSLKSKHRLRQYKAFVQGYNAATDSIKKNGLKAYAELIKKHTKVDDKVINALPAVSFGHMKAPREKDIARAKRWLK